MKMYWRTLIAGVVLGLTQLNAPGSVSFSAGLDIHATADFEAPLASLGAWVNVGSYGHCWRPSGVGVSWRPYCNGQWVSTDCGWYWDSDEPWAWACYHYGSWVDDSSYGWVWVPGVQWAPAWVVWRESPDYVGWAPCGPNGGVSAGASFGFVDVHHFNDRISPHDMVFNDPRIMSRTTMINNLKVENRTVDGTEQRVVVNNGPSVTKIERETGARFEARPISEVAARTSAPESVRRASPVRNGTEYQTPARTPERTFTEPPSKYRQPTTRDENQRTFTSPPSQQREVSPPTYRNDVTPPAQRDVTPPAREYQYRDVPQSVPNNSRQAVPPTTYRHDVTPPAQAEPQRPMTPREVPTSPEMNHTPRQSEQVAPGSRTLTPPGGTVQSRPAMRTPAQAAPPEKKKDQQEQK